MGGVGVIAHGGSCLVSLTGEKPWSARPIKAQILPSCGQSLAWSLRRASPCRQANSLGRRCSLVNLIAQLVLLLGFVRNLLLLCLIFNTALSSLRCLALMGRDKLWQVTL